MSPKQGCRVRSVNISPRFSGGRPADFLRFSALFSDPPIVRFSPSRGSSAITRYSFSLAIQKSGRPFNFVFLRKNFGGSSAIPRSLFFAANVRTFRAENGVSSVKTAADSRLKNSGEKQTLRIRQPCSEV